MNYLFSLPKMIISEEPKTSKIEDLKSKYAKKYGL